MVKGAAVMKNESYYIKDFRLKSGYTQQELADKVGITKAAISKYEKGQRQPRLEMLKKIAEVFGVNWTDLVSEEQRELEEAIQDAEADSDYWEAVLLSTEAHKRIASLLHLLNEEGQKKAVERVLELTEIPRYQRQTEGTETEPEGE